MDQFTTRTFHGDINELVQYHMVLIDTSAWAHTVRQHRFFLLHQLLIGFDELEELCGWCITESVKRAFPEIRLLGHGFVDKYEQAYDTLFQNQDFTMRQRLAGYLRNCRVIRCLRVMPMLDKTMIGIGS